MFLHLMRLQCISAFPVARKFGREGLPQLGGCRYPCRHRSVSQIALGCTAIPGREDRDKSRSCAAIMEKKVAYRPYRLSLRSFGPGDCRSCLIFALPFSLVPQPHHVRYL